MPKLSGQSDPIFDALAYKLQLMLDRWRIVNGRVIVAEPEAAVCWLDMKIAEMETGR